MRKKILILFLLALVVAIGASGAWYYWTHRYDKLIATTAQKHGLDPRLVKAIIYEESFFSPRAQSSQKAVGLMQVTPIVAQELIEATRSPSLSQAVASLTGGPYDANATFEDGFSDPVVSLNVGCWYLKNLLDRYRDEPDPISVALAAYNAGPSNVERWASNADRSSLSREEFIARIEFPVTRNYVQKIIQRYDYYKRDQDIKQ